MPLTVTSLKSFVKAREKAPKVRAAVIPLFENFPHKFWTQEFVRLDGHKFWTQEFVRLDGHKFTGPFERNNLPPLAFVDERVASSLATSSAA